MTHRDGDVDFSTFSSEELREARDGIDAKRYPVNAGNLLAEMAARGIGTNDGPDDSPLDFGVVRRCIFYAVIALMVVVFDYGIDRFPDAPIEPCGVDRFCGKQGQAHTKEDYVAFRRWQAAIFVLWPCGMLIVPAVLALSRGRTRRSRKTTA